MVEILNAKGIEIKRVDLKRDPKLLKNLAVLYAEVFSGPPWNEYTRCLLSGKFYGRETEVSKPCPDCASPLLPAYEADETIKYILKEMEKKNSVIFVGEANQKLVAFSWGYSYDSPDEFASEKYKTEEMQRKITDLLKNQGISRKFYYFSESGIVEAFRGKGLTNDFYTLRLEIPRKLGLSVLVRTLCTSPIVAVAQKFNFQQIMGPEPEIDKLRRTIEPTTNIINNFEDAEIENRVLFMLK